MSSKRVGNNQKGRCGVTRQLPRSIHSQTEDSSRRHESRQQTASNCCLQAACAEALMGAYACSIRGFIVDNRLSESEVSQQQGPQPPSVAGFSSFATTIHSFGFTDSTEPGQQINGGRGRSARSPSIPPLEVGRHPPPDSGSAKPLVRFCFFPWC